MGDGRLGQVLHRIAADARPARLGPDLWERGRRRRRRTVATAVVAVLVVLGAAPVVLPRVHADGYAPAGGDRPVVPARVYPPLTGQAGVVEHPTGPAALVVSGDRELRGSDIWGWEGRSLLVARDGRYRLARTVGEVSAGVGDLLLSPDGRRLAAMPWLEGVAYQHDVAGPGGPQGVTAVVELGTGENRTYPGGYPLAWSPDGDSLLLRPATEDSRLGGLNLLDLATGRVRALPRIDEEFRLGNLAAFSPDGARLAVATVDALYVVETAGMTVRRIATLTPAERLAGPGAWSPDGTRLAMWTMGDCEDGTTCDERRLARRAIRPGWRDATTGAVVDGPRLPAARGLAARLLGWQGDGDAVVVEYQPEAGLTREPDNPRWSETDWWAVGSVTLTELRRDGSRHRLVDLPGSALFVDVPAGLLDSFGGPSPSRVEGAVRWLLALWWPLGQFVLLLVAAVVAGSGLRRWRRRTRRR
ncbi:hypothetical protein K7640_20200 [Micromonospora sp. PLK6-60]|uniref:WD40 repeat domain-containing protein n=1 Tax=Micromonospora sp. PLK6-60 TaxID=2873383 RepID=UPI001CA68340|nr:hypothetical protein [Micromonospora sp. PLK6-60]MBY8874153.1 hypothetical protein [Micromonospora sp. PLK6-60]